MIDAYSYLLKFTFWEITVFDVVHEHSEISDNKMTMKFFIDPLLVSRWKFAYIFVCRFSLYQSYKNFSDSSLKTRQFFQKEKNIGSIVEQKSQKGNPGITAEDSG